MSWVCNECGSVEFTGSVSPDEVEKCSCTGCGGWDFHWEDDEEDEYESQKFI